MTKEQIQAQMVGDQQRLEAAQAAKRGLTGAVAAAQEAIEFTRAAIAAVPSQHTEMVYRLAEVHELAAKLLATASEHEVTVEVRARGVEVQLEILGRVLASAGGGS